MSDACRIRNGSPPDRVVDSTQSWVEEKGHLVRWEDQYFEAMS